jgi:hypothetical protein
MALRNHVCANPDRHRPMPPDRGRTPQPPIKQAPVSRRVALTPARPRGGSLSGLGVDDEAPRTCVLHKIGALLVSGGGLEPPRPIKGTSTSS